MLLEKIFKKSILSILPVLSTFSMIGVHDCVDLHAIFLFERLNSLSLDVSKVLKEV